MPITLLLLAPVAVPLLTAACYLLARWRPATTAWLAPAASAAVLTCAIALAVTITRHGPRTTTGGLVRADALSAFMLIVIGAVGLLATAASPAWLRGEITAGRATIRTATRHSVLVQVFLAAMATAVLAASLGMTWIAIEATTIATAFLVGQRRTRAATEAAWKYVMICSTGIALALLGALFLNDAASHAPGRAGLDWHGLLIAAPHLNQPVTRIAVALLILGFGTKAGLVPLHAWLPDAHGQAPAPVSALMSGVLLSVAFYAVLRVKAISDAALGAGFARTLLAVLAVGSLLLAASLLLAQRDYKRMLAYSSIEHMALLALGAAAGSPLALAAVLLQMLGHGMAKAILFLSAGQLLQSAGTTRISQVRSLASRDPVLAGCAGLGILALIGLPPFSIFASETGIIRAGFATGLGWVTATALLLAVIIAAALITRTSGMLLGADPGPVWSRDAGRAAPQDPSAPAPAAAAPATSKVPLAAGLAACAVLGVYAGPLLTLLHLAAATMTRTP